MFPRRYILTLVSLIPILLTHTCLAILAFRRARESRKTMQLWSAGAGVLAFLILLSVHTDSTQSAWFPRWLMVSAPAFVNITGLVGAAVLGIWLPLRAIIRGLPGAFREDRRVALQAIAGMGIAAPMGVAGFGVFIERTNFEVCETPIAIRDLPGDLEGMRLVQISDIHLGPYLSAKSLARVIDGANELRGDVFFITGDLISAKGDPLDECLAQLARLNRNTPKLGCLGNHEVYADAVDYTVRHGAAAGIEFLRNRTRTIKVGDAVLNVAGVDYQAIGKRSTYLRHGAAMIMPGTVNILLSHNPDVFPVAAAQGYDLTLAGHTHGGQVTLEFLSPSLNPARMLTPYVRGLYRDGDRSCYVTRGIGTLGVPARLGSRPEITALTLHRA